jgi:chromosome segregation ATPase
VCSARGADFASTQLREERAACQWAEDQLQRERAALVEAQAALEREHLAQKEAEGRLQQEHTALEGAQATLKQRDDNVSRLNGELVQLSISHEDLCQSLEEQEATVRDLRREAEGARKALDSERKQVECELRFRLFSFIDLASSRSVPDFCFFFVGFQACEPPWGI